MSERYTVRITKDYLVFCCGHFISFNGDSCERLHGHNYRATVEVDGPLDENCYLFDFIALKNTMRALTDELDHHMLLPTKNRLIQVEANDNEVHVRFRNKKWLFPREDCVLLPIENTTAELIARYLTQRLRTELKNQFQFEPEAIRMEVDESFGQTAKYEWVR
jgi:6-pyruvoyltetrahydropterin/6-carboxytetrahydropterin synthase